jgi:hypothetical protein
MSFKSNMELEELYDLRRDLEEQSDHFFDHCSDNEKNLGDSGYQNLLTHIGDLSEQIKGIETEFDDNPDVQDQSIFGEPLDSYLGVDIDDEDFLGSGIENEITIDDLS